MQQRFDSNDKALEEQKMGRLKLDNGKTGDALGNVNRRKRSRGKE
jgi:hypothetical protein